MRMKKMAAAVVAMVTALALTACAGGFDASKYVQGVLNNIYLGDSAAYMEMVDITAEEQRKNMNRVWKSKQISSSSIMDWTPFLMRYIRKSLICIIRFTASPNSK